MSKDKKKFYAKFKMNTELRFMESMFVSEDFEAAKEWTHKQSKEREEIKEEIIEKEISFKNVARKFEKSMGEFRDSMPFFMEAMPLMRNLSSDGTIRKFAAKNSYRMEEGEYELYEMDIEHITEVNKRIESSNSIQGGISLLPKMFILGLISAYDLFLSSLIRAVLLTKPEILSTSERNISFKDLVETGSIEVARERIIEKEIETVIRSSHAEQIEWLEKKLNMTLTKDLAIWPDFIELCERRNSLAHNGGIISSQYLSVCRMHGYNVDGKQVGEKLRINHAYYHKAVSIVTELGIKLTQVVWRKLIPAQISDAADELNEFAYGLIIKNQYKFAESMYKFALYTMKKHGSDAIRKRMVVNYANAIKLGGDKPRAEKILDDEDWSATTDTYRICVAAVRDDVGAVITMMKRAVESKTIDISHIRNWAVFEKIRTVPEFVEAFESEFGEKLLLNQETNPPSTASQGDSAFTTAGATGGDADQTPIDESSEDKTLH